MIRQTISCDICGADKKESNHWFVALEREGEIRLGTWAALGRRRSGARHLCGQKCLYKLVDDFFVRRALGLRPSTDLPAELSGSLALPEALPTVLTSAQPELQSAIQPAAQPAIQPPMQPPPAPRSGGHRTRPQRSTPAPAQAVPAQPAPTQPVPAAPSASPSASVPAGSTRRKAVSRANPTSASAQPTPSVRSAEDFPDLDSPLAPPRSTRIHRDGASPRRESAIPAAAARRASAPAAKPTASRLHASHLNHPAQSVPAQPIADEFGSSARLIPTPPDRLARHAAEAAERARAWRPAVLPTPPAAQPQQSHPQQAQQPQSHQSQSHQQQAEAAHAAADRRRILDAWQRERAREQGATLRTGSAQPDSRPAGRSPSRLTAMLRPRILEA